MAQISPILTDHEIEVEIGSRLRATRKSRTLRLHDAGKHAGLSRRTVYRAEIGDNPTLLTLLRLFRLYGRLAELDSLLRAPEISPMAILREAKPPAPPARTKGTRAKAPPKKLPRDKDPRRR